MKQTLPNFKTDFPDWYNAVVYEAELVDQAPVKGCVVIRPYGYALWENIRSVLDKRFKETGHQNAAFPLLIPVSFFQKEAEHVEGFAPELAVVTEAGGKKLEEPLAIRPTSETIIHSMFARWIHSWRDLPVKINQWCSVVRWEKRPRPFLRTTEFWWQEGHTAHETQEEAREEAELMHTIYRDFMQDHLAIPVVAAKKPEHEYFAGADVTYALEAFMPDGKAVQMGTSHLISQSFARSFNMMFQDRNGNQAYPFLTSWGVSTRMIGGLIMTHGDEKGLILPPAIAPIQVVIVPILKGESKGLVLEMAHKVNEILKKEIRTTIDADESTTPGAKFYKWELKGVPLRIEIGPRDLDNNQAVMVDRLGLEKKPHSLDGLLTAVKEQLGMLQQALFERALKRRDEQWTISTKNLDEIGPELAEGGKFYQVSWCGCEDAVAKLKEYKGTFRCVLKQEASPHCFCCGKPSTTDVLIAKAY